MLSKRDCKAFQHQDPTKDDPDGSPQASVTVDLNNRPPHLHANVKNRFIANSYLDILDNSLRRIQSRDLRQSDGVRSWGKFSFLARQDSAADRGCAEIVSPSRADKIQPGSELRESRYQPSPATRGSLVAAVPCLSSLLKPHRRNP